MPTHTIHVLDAAAAKEARLLPPSDWPKAGFRAGVGIFDAVTHRLSKVDPRNALRVGRGAKAGELVLYSPHCRAVATITSRCDGLEIHDLLPPAPVPGDAVSYLADFKFLPKAGGAPVDPLGPELIALLETRPPPPPPLPPLRIRRRLTDEELLPTISSLTDATKTRLRDVPTNIRRGFLPYSARAQIDEVQAVCNFVEEHGAKPPAYLPELLRPLTTATPPDDLEIDSRVRRALRTALGIPLVSLLCTPAFDDQRLHQALAALSRLPLLQEDRAVLWLDMSRGVPPPERPSELEQIAKDLAHAAADSKHAAIWKNVVRTWIEEGLEALPEGDVDTARQLRQILEAKWASPADFLRWQDLRFHVWRRPPSPPLPLPVAPPPPRHRTLLDLARHRLCGGTDEVLAALGALREAEMGWAAAPFSKTSLGGLRASLERALDALRAQQASLPAAEEVAAAERTMEEIAAVLGFGLEAPLPHSLADLVAATDGLDQVHAAAELTARAERALPAWVWRGLSYTPARVAAVAADLDFHDDLVACLRWAEEPSLTSPGDLRDLIDAGSGSLLERLRAGHEERTRSRERDERVAGITSITSDETRAHLAAGWPETEPEIAAREKLAERFASLAEALGEQAREDLRARIAASSVEEGAACVRKVERVRANLQEEQEEISDLSLTKILAFARRLPETVRPPTVVVPSFSFGPPLSSSPTGGTHHARGIFQPFESLQAYGTVSLPVRLTFEQALPAPIQLKIKVTRTSGDFRTPTQLTAHEEVPPLEVLPGTTPHDFEIKVVLSRTFAEEMAAGKRRNLEVVVEGTGPGGKSGKTTLTFTAMAMAMPPYRDPIPGTVQPEDMLQCPVGVESHYDALLTHVRQGASSFYVCGPRRFGKTSLLNAIEKLVGAGDVVVLKCVTASMRPLSSLWNEDIVKSFQERFGRRPDTELEDKLLPADYAYDSIREVAAARGIRAIYVLIDEAQAMFAHPRRAELAERLKERLEHAWMAVSEDGKVKRAAILFGFIGQGHLPRLLTPNFRASLKDYARFEFTDEEILGLLKRTTGADGLQSTKEAREHLARLAGNLFILNRLLKELHSLCTEGRRTWFLRADVDRASAKLEAAFRDGAGSDIWDWVRDPLNESDDRNDWQPSTTYPVALAWAGARARGTSGRAGALALLKQFCPRAEPLDERVSEALRELSDLRVLDPQGDFKLPMLERLLAIRAESPTPLSEAEQEAAQRLGLARVRRPPPERSDDDDPPEVQGGQARVWRAEWEGHVAAVRAISLSDKTHARTRFIHEVTLLRKIGKAGGQRVQLRLPRIFEMGIAEDDPSTGLVIYEWIPGYPLPEASMTEPAVAEVGLQMADVLDVLEQIGVVHRDIRPANVLLRVPTEGRDARVAIDVVLIDFGLARAVEHLRGGPRSIVEGVAVYIPPEVYGTGDAAAWSTAGDVYSTGVMLEKLLRPGSAADHAPSSRQLLALIGDMKARLPADRPTAAQLRTRLHDVVKSLEAEHKSTRLDQIEEAVRQRVVTLPEPVRTSAQDYVHTLVYLRAGMLRDERRYTAVSAFLENAFRRIIKAKVPRYALPTNVYLRSARDLLAAARLDTPAWFDERRTEAVGLLRNAEHHPDDFNGILDRALSQLGSSYSAPDRDARLFEALEHVARLLDEVTRSSQVAILVAEVLRTGAPGQTPRAP